jgi:transposase InsO family protein
MQMQGKLGLREMCEMAGISRASYYRRWQSWKPTEEQMALRDRLQGLALKYRYYGYRPITKLLKREGWVVNHKRVLRLMREDNLLSLRRRKFVATTQRDADQRVYPNLARRMQLSGLDQLWVADITYVRLRTEFVYVAVILDVYSRRVVGWSIGRHLDSTLAQRALQRAVHQRQPRAGLVHHSDRGWQYACQEYTALLAGWGIEASMSRAGNPWDNAFAESFMKTLKTEEVDGRRYRNLEEATTLIETFIDEFYNQERLHSALGYQSPADFEANFKRSLIGECGMLSNAEAREGGSLPPSLALPSPAQNKNVAGIV